MSVSSGSEHRSIIPMLNKIFSKYFIVFGVFPHTTANFIKLFSSRCNRTIHIHVSLLLSVFLLFVCLFVLLLFYFWYYNSILFRN